MAKTISNKPLVAATPAIRILKSAACPNLSGKSSIEYHIGCTPDGEIYMRIAKSAGGGYFSGEWIAFKAIQAALEKARKPLTSYALWGLFKGKSINSPGFLFAALKAEVLVEHDIDKPRCYALTDPSGFIAEMEKLITSDVNLKVADDVPVMATPDSPSKGSKMAS